MSVPDAAYDTKCYVSTGHRRTVPYVSTGQRARYLSESSSACRAARTWIGHVRTGQRIANARRWQHVSHLKTLPEQQGFEGLDYKQRASLTSSCFSISLLSGSTARDVSTAQ
eukprot:1216244-Rhodomonas_salina.1